jgi:hypothetical protein
MAEVGTVRNNQFIFPKAWQDCLIALEQATIVIQAIAVTNYCVTDTYGAPPQSRRATPSREASISECRVAV